MKDLQAVILAAGKSTRMGNGCSKLLYKVNKKTIIRSVVEACEIHEISRINLIVGFDALSIKNELGDKYIYYDQEPQMGTGHALLKFMELNKNYKGDLLVLVGDTPFINQSLLSDFIFTFRKFNNDILFTTAQFESYVPPYARVLRDNDGRIDRILEDFECNQGDKSIGEVVTSQYCFSSTVFNEKLFDLNRRGINNEYYLNDIINLSIRDGFRIDSYQVKNQMLVFGINSTEDLDYAKQNFKIIF